MQHWPRKSKPVRSSYSLLLLACVLAVAMPGCKKKHARVVQPQTITTAEVVAPKGSDAPVAIAGVTNVDFATLSIRGRGSFENEEQNASFNYKINIEKGRRIWASLSLFGIEGARILATPDSFWVIDRINKQYAAQGYRYLEDKIGLRLDFNLLQNVLLGNAGPVSAKNLTVADAEHFSIRNQTMLLQYTLATSGGKVLQVEAADSARAPLSTINYSEFSTLERQTMPMQVLVQVLRPKANVVTLAHREVDVHPQNLNFSFSIPDGYAEVK